MVVLQEGIYFRASESDALGRPAAEDRSEGPQPVSVRGRDEVVVIAVEEFRVLKGSATGQALIDGMQASPRRDVEIEPRRGTMAVRDVSL